MALVTRAGKGSALTHNEMDANLEGLANGSLWLPTAALNMNGQQLQSMCIESRTSDPAAPAEGQIWLRTDL